MIEILNIRFFYGGRGTIEMIIYKKIAMDEEILRKIELQSAQLERIYDSVEKTRKYFLWTLVATILTVAVPLLGLVFAIPYFLRSLSTVSGL